MTLLTPGMLPSKPFKQTRWFNFSIINTKQIFTFQDSLNSSPFCVPQSLLYCDPYSMPVRLLHRKTCFKPDLKPPNLSPLRCRQCAVPLIRMSSHLSLAFSKGRLGAIFRRPVFDKGTVCFLGLLEEYSLLIKEIYFPFVFFFSPLRNLWHRDAFCVFLYAISSVCKEEGTGADAVSLPPISLGPNILPIPNYQNLCMCLRVLPSPNSDLEKAA